MIGWIILGLIAWTVLGFFVWSCITVGHQYREPITEADIKALMEAERAASLAEAECAWPIAAERDRASFHNASVTTR